MLHHHIQSSQRTSTSFTSEGSFLTQQILIILNANCSNEAKMVNSIFALFFYSLKTAIIIYYNSENIS